MDRIERDVLINASRQRVWDALTSAEHGTGRAIVEKVEPESFFSWRRPGPLGPDPVPGNATLVEFTLTPADGGTLLQVVESGFTRLDLPPEEQERYAAGNVDGWGRELDELREHLEK